MAWTRVARLAAALSCVAITAAGCGGRAGAGSEGAATIVPASAPAYVAVDTDLGSDQWSTVDQLASKFPDKQSAVDSLERQLRQAGLDYANDVEPALGPELDVVWLDFDNNGENVVALLQPDDAAAFERLVAKANAKDPDNQLVSGKVGDWQALAAKQSLIDRFRTATEAGGPVLADDPSFRSAMGSVSELSLAKLYVSGSKVMNAIREYAGTGADDVVAQLGNLDWIVAAARATDDGLRFDAVVRGTPGKALDGSGAPLFTATLPKRVPAGAVLYYTFHGSKGLLGGIGNTPKLSAQLGPAAGVLRSVGALLQGENAVYVRPPASGTIPEVTLVTEPRAGTDGAAALDRLLARFGPDLGVRPRRTAVKGIPARSLGFGAFRVVYANVSGHLVVTTQPAGILAFAAPSSTLSGDQTFKDALDKAGLPDKTQGFLFVNVRGGARLAQRLGSLPIPGDVQRNLAPLRSALEYAVTRPSEVQVTLFVRID